MQIDSDSLAVFYETFLALIAIDHADAAMDREKSGWYCEMPAGEARVPHPRLCRPVTAPEFGSIGP